MSLSANRNPPRIKSQAGFRQDTRYDDSRGDHAGSDA